MTQSTLSDEIALRIGLAARALPDTDIARLLRVLADAVGLPPTAVSLNELTVKGLKHAADGEFADVDNAALKEALARLKGQGSSEIEPAPDPESYSDGELPSSIRVACASNGGELLDGHFGSCQRFLVYQVSADSYKLIDCRDIDAAAGEQQDDKNSYRASLIADCQILYVASIGGPAAAKVVKRDIHPIKRPQMGNAREHIAELSRILADKAPPWLAKIMGTATESRVHFERTPEEA
ncbi:dinitrogenase iron-molybdenum cofactor biosynthesis protein [Halochromatium salexigens]|uniref:Dinitrogenase iron-molybdenum cofactor biosynthesis protein n=1 Tax=Halochromatium salexigens TaxID=49447 RepID=A0AAJ0UH30_HALSE|nr:dinitrogenase iron-molybdenum cofactor biosynthesis protein [Halochromatium salexigens]MBK5931344.1 dinitrogenase iron-molybdenum cofactor biosynthesis protein [Halochromatium salexigens]